jgi:PAS domain S-box-containing protein
MSRAYTSKNNSGDELQPSLSDELYREIFVHSNEPIAINDPEGYYVEQNSAHRELLGYDDDELEGKTPAIHG